MSKYDCDTCHDTGLTFTKGKLSPWGTCSNKHCRLYSHKDLVRKYDKSNCTHPFDVIGVVFGMLDFLNEHSSHRYLNKEEAAQEAFDSVLKDDANSKINPSVTTPRAMQFDLQPNGVKRVDEYADACQHKNTVVSSNFLGTEKFNYCRDCKKEIK